MKLYLYVLICFQVVVADKPIELGLNVTINCPLDENEVYWISQKTLDPPTVILRSFLNSQSPYYLNKAFSKKYSVQFKHRLIINNLTSDELGIYYCMKTGAPPKLSKSIRVYITDQSNSNQNQSAVKCIEQNRTAVTNYNAQNEMQWTIIIISALINGLLIIVVVGLVKVFVVGNKRSTECQQQKNTDPRQFQVIERHQEPDQLQYATMDFSKFRNKMRSSQVNYTYAALNLPKSRMQQ